MQVTKFFLVFVSVIVAHSSFAGSSTTNLNSICQANSDNMSSSGVAGCCGSYNYLTTSATTGTTGTPYETYTCNPNTDPYNPTATIQSYDSDGSVSSTSTLTYSYGGKIEAGDSGTATVIEFTAQCAPTTSGGSSYPPYSISAHCDNDSIMCYEKGNASSTEVNFECQNVNSTDAYSFYVDAIDCTSYALPLDSSGQPTSNNTLVFLSGCSMGSYGSSYN